MTVTPVVPPIVPVAAPVAASAARWDGRRIHFDIVVSGVDVACAISSAALREMSGQNRYSPADLLRCFGEHRTRIEAIARRRAEEHEDSISGIISIWEDDVDAPRQ
jgi:hypothetical protein